MTAKPAQGTVRTCDTCGAYAKIDGRCHATPALYQRKPGDWCDQWYKGGGPVVQVRPDVELQPDDPDDLTPREGDSPQAWHWYRKATEAQERLEQLCDPDASLHHQVAHALVRKAGIPLNVDWCARQVSAFVEALRDEVDDVVDLPEVALVILQCGEERDSGVCGRPLHPHQVEDFVDSMERELRCPTHGGQVLRADTLFFHRATLALLRHAATLNWPHTEGAFAVLVRDWQAAGCPDKDGPPRVSTVQRGEALDLDLARIFAGMTCERAAVSIIREGGGVFRVRAWEDTGSGDEVTVRADSDEHGMHDAIAAARAVLYGDKEDDAQQELDLQGGD